MFVPFVSIYSIYGLGLIKMGWWVGLGWVGMGWAWGLVWLGGYLSTTLFAKILDRD
jgi:hypothetical protein